MAAAGCSSDTDATPGPESTAPSSTASEKDPAQGTTSRHSSVSDDLTASEATAPYGMIGSPSILRAGNGTTMLVYEPTWPAERTTYRLYDRNWEPRTPLLRVPVSLDVVRTTVNRFVGSAARTRQNGSGSMRWITIDSGGQIHEVSGQPERGSRAARPRSGDVNLGGDHGGRFAYRPSTDTVFRTPRLPWESSRFVWRLTNDGMLCAVRSGPLTEGVARVSRDEGRTFFEVPIVDVLPVDSGPRLQYCNVTRGGVVIETGGESPRWLHHLDRTGRHLISSQPLGGPLDPYDWGHLPDGRLVTGTNRPGIMVATDPLNRSMDHRLTPAPMQVWLDIVGDEFLVIGGGFVHVSKDAGLTWERFDLHLP
jgi:hypothetical protein